MQPTHGWPSWRLPMPNPVTREEFDAAVSRSANLLGGEAARELLKLYADQMEAALTTANERIKLDAETIKAVIKARDAKNTHE